MNEKLCDILLFVFMSSVSLLSCLFWQREHIPTVQSFSTILQFGQLSRTCNLHRKERSFGAALLCWLFLYINDCCPRFKLLELSYNVYAVIITLLILIWLHNMVWVGRGKIHITPRIQFLRSPLHQYLIWKLPNHCQVHNQCLLVIIVQVAMWTKTLKKWPRQGG